MRMGRRLAAKLFAAAFQVTVIAGILCAGPLPAQASGEIFAKPDRNGTVDVSTSRPARTLVVVMSGDGGWWGDLDAQLANRIARAGYAVVGIDTNIWFTSRRTPREVADHLADLVRTYMTKTGALKYVLVGYSFGADMVAPAFTRMGGALESEAGALVMLSPGKLASFQVNLMEETGVAQGTYSLSADFRRLPKALTLCVFGADEASDTGCKDPSLAGAAVLALPGGHHYHHDTTTLAARVLSDLKRKTPA